MNKGKISIISSALRIELWPKFIESFKLNNCIYEIIFVGPKKPNFHLPNFCRHIKSNVKPPQCWEIGFRSANYDLILIMADDTFFINDNALDNLLSLWEKNNIDNKLIISNKYSIENNLFDENAFKLKYKNTNPVTYAKLENGSDIKIPFQPLFHKDLIDQVGGLDNRFVITCWEIDIFLNAISRNYKIIESNEIIDEKRYGTNTSTNLGDYSSKDFSLLFYLWFNKKGILLKKRREKVKFYNKDQLYSKTQGNKGKWIFTNEFYSRFIISNTYSSLKKIYNNIKTLIKIYLLRKS